MTGDKQHDATTEFNEALAAGFAAGSFDAMGPFYTEDAHVLPPRGKIVEGREAIAAFWRNVANRFNAVSFTTVDLKPLGEAARRETGTYTMSAGDDQSVQGKYVFVWQLVDGEWQIESCIWNRSGGDAGAGGRQGQGQGQGQRGQRGGGQGAGRGGAGQGGYRQGGGQGGGQAGYRQGGQGGGGQGGYRQGGGRPSFQAGGGGGGGQRRGRGQGGGQGGYGGGGGLYDGNGGLYANPKD